MPTRDQLVEQDIQELHRLGYAQQLFREMGGFSNFAISFSIISILTGAVLLYGYGLKFAGPIINSVGWPLVSLLTLCVAASMAELASAYPTAGGLYFWAFRLGGRGWAWVTAWLNMIGQVTISTITLYLAYVIPIYLNWRNPPAPWRVHRARERALDPRALERRVQRGRDPLGRLHRRRLRAAPERAGAVDDAGRRHRPGCVLATLGAAPLRRSDDDDAPRQPLSP